MSWLCAHEFFIKSHICHKSYLYVLLNPDHLLSGVAVRHALTRLLPSPDSQEDSSSSIMYSVSSNSCGMLH